MAFKHDKQSQQKQIYIGKTASHNGSATVVMPAWGRDIHNTSRNVEKLKPSNTFNWGI